MRNLLVAVALALGMLGARAETAQQWLDAAPHADVVFTPWLSSPGAPADEEVRPITQNCYGYLDLSRLPADAFPIRARLFYEAVTSDRNDDSSDSRVGGLGRNAVLPSPQVTEEPPSPRPPPPLPFPSGVPLFLCSASSPLASSMTWSASKSSTAPASRSTAAFSPPVPPPAD
jgi:hypothetical protein